jgi:hypothetical protein
VSLITSLQPSSVTPLVVLRGLCAAIAAIVVVDAIAVGAPGLALLAVPFLIAAAALRRESTIPMVALTVLAAVYVLIGVNYAVANGFDAEWGDLLFAYGGTPVAAAIGALAVMRLAQRHRVA